MDSLSDPTGSAPIVAAVLWLQGTLLGTIATIVAVIAVAAVGFGMLSGRTNWRYGASVIIGSFILVGASSIVAGMRSAIGPNEPTGLSTIELRLHRNLSHWTRYRIFRRHLLHQNRILMPVWVFLIDDPLRNVLAFAMARRGGL